MNPYRVLGPGRCRSKRSEAIQSKSMNLTNTEVHTEGNYLRISDPSNDEAWLKSDTYVNVGN